MNRLASAWTCLIWAGLAAGCAVGVVETGPSGSANDAGGAASDQTGSQSYGETGGDAAAPAADAGKTTIAKDAGSKPAVVDSGSSPPTSGCADPSTPAGCTCASGHTCAANNCYGGYLCDTAINKCKSPTACP